MRGIALLTACLAAMTLASCGKKPKEPDAPNAVNTPSTTAPPASARKLTPLYRFWDKRVNEHVYTYEGSEPVDWRNSGHFDQESVVGYGVNTAEADHVRITRDYRRDGRHYFYITKPANATDIERNEGMEFFAWTKPGDGRIPVHACILPDSTDAFFERNLDRVKSYTEGTLKVIGKQRTIVESMFYLYPTGPAPSVTPARPPVSTPPVATPNTPSKTTETLTELGTVRAVREKAFSPDSRFLLTVTGNVGSGVAHYEVQMWNLATGKQTAKFYTGNGEPDSPSFSADGKRVAFTLPNFKGAREVVMLDAGTGADRVALTLPRVEKGMTFLGFSHDGGSVLAAVDKAILRLSLPSGESRTLSGLQPDEHTRFSNSPTAPQLVALPIGTNTLVVLNTNSGDAETYPLSKGETATEVNYSGDGRALAVSRINCIELWDTKAWKRRAILPRSTSDELAGIFQSSVSGDGRVVVASSTSDTPDRKRQGTHRVNVWSTPGAQPLQLDKGFGDALVSPDGMMIATTFQRRFAVYDLATGKPKSFAP